MAKVKLIGLTAANERGVLGTNALRACMSRNIKKVSHACVGALVAAGEMTQAQADKLHGKGKATHKKTTHKKTTHKKTASSKKKH